jgi:hypothetical protein
MKLGIFALILSFLFTLNTQNADAQVLDRVFKNWSVYTATLKGYKTCYIASFPKSKTGNYNRRDEPYFLVTRIADNSYEVSTTSGYGYKLNSDVRIDVDGFKYNMFTKGELAWSYNSSQDNKIIDSMKKKINMTVRGVSTKGTYSIDKYSLAGFTAAYNRMQEVCG